MLPVFALVAAGMKPPVGAVYTQSVHVPLVGAQHISLKIESVTDATIRLHGLFEHSERIGYVVADDYRVAFRFSDDLKRKLRRFRASITEPRYDPEADAAYVRLRLDLLRLSRPLTLPRG